MPQSPADEESFPLPNVLPILPPPDAPRLPVAVLFVHGMWHGRWCRDHG